ncbi:MAG: 4-hydroxy-3-methylbut-2-enyl diphosphate reductase, partial [Deltaproteobacteria bacterium]
MQVLLADALGFCFGVRDALGAAEQTPRPDAVTIYGELVHNEQVQARLGSLGFRSASEADRSRIPATPLVMITA